MWNRVVLCLLAVAIGLALASPILAAEAASADDGGMNPFSLSAWKTDLALWTAVVFLCLLAILAKFAWGPLTAGLDKRENYVADQIAQAEAAHEKAKELLAEHERKLAAARDEVRGIVDQGRREAESLGRELLDKAKTEATAEHARAMLQIEAAADAAVKNLAGRSATLAVELAGKIVGVKLKASDHARLIEQAVAGFVEDRN